MTHNIVIKKHPSVKIHPTVEFIGSGEIILHEKVQLRAYTVIEMDGILEINDNSVIGYHNFIQCSGDMYIGNGTLIGPNTVLLASSHKISNLPLIKEKMIKGKLFIGNNVWIGANCTINYNIEIHDNVVIGANSFVNKSIDDNKIVGGVPAKELKVR